MTPSLGVEQVDFPSALDVLYALVPMMTLADQVQAMLQIAGWLLTLLGQVQLAVRSRSCFASWVAANFVLMALSASASLWWSIGMYATNTVVCLWSYRRWGREPQAMRPLFVKRSGR